MKRLSHPAALLSIALAASASAFAAPTAKSPYYGRWTVADEKPVFSSRGIAYKTIDVAPCGNDFCGVSVAEGGACGPVLFRFLSKNASGENTLHGHGRWGKVKKNVQINTWEDSELPGGRMVEIYLGDGHDFGERSENMPKFHATYRPNGAAKCRAS